MDAIYSVPPRLHTLETKWWSISKLLIMPPALVELISVEGGLVVINVKEI